MITIAALLARVFETFRIVPNSTEADIYAETVATLAKWYGKGGLIPAEEIFLAEELFVNRYLAHNFETWIGKHGLFTKKGDNPEGALHPAVNAAIRARGRYAKIVRDLSKRHSPAKSAPSNVAPASRNGATPATNTHPGRGTGVSPVHQAPAPAEQKTPPAPATSTTLPIAADPLPAANGTTPIPPPVAPVFMNRAMRRLAERNAVRTAKKEAKAACAD